MPELIYSKEDPSVLLLAINRKAEITSSRVDVCPEDQYLQICAKSMPKDLTFKPHKHNKLERVTDYTQEAWIILDGSVKASFWDINDEPILETTLGSGDCAIVFRAGHSFEVLEDETILYEIKSGPYYGVERDKSFLENDSDL